MRVTLPVSLVLAIALSGCTDVAPPAEDGDEPTTVSPADPAALLALVEEQVVRPNGEPRYRTPGTTGHDEARSLIVGMLEARGLDVVERSFTVDLPLTGEVGITNILGARQGPSGREIWLAAHWDSRALADEDPDPSLRDGPCLGANDGAAAVAVVVHALDLLPPTNATVRIVLFDGEDQGRGGSGWAIGSARQAQAMGDAEIDRIEAMLLVDMPGDAELQVRREGYGAAQAPELHDLVFSVAAQRNATSFIDEPGPAILDDHKPFLDRGVPAIDLIHLDDDPRRGPFPWTHHTTHDTMENLSGESMAEVTDVVVASVLALDAGLA